MDGTQIDLCPLEWIALAMEAARLAAERDETGTFKLDYSNFYTEKLVGL